MFNLSISFCLYFFLVERTKFSERYLFLSVFIELPISVAFRNPEIFLAKDSVSSDFFAHPRFVGGLKKAIRFHNLDTNVKLNTNG